MPVGFPLCAIWFPIFPKWNPVKARMETRSGLMETRFRAYAVVNRAAFDEDRRRRTRQRRLPEPR